MEKLQQPIEKQQPAIEKLLYYRNLYGEPDTNKKPPKTY